MSGFRKHGCTYLCSVWPMTREKMYYFILGYGEKSMKNTQDFLSIADSFLSSFRIHPGVGKQRQKEMVDKIKFLSEFD